MLTYKKHTNLSKDSIFLQKFEFNLGSNKLCSKNQHDMFCYIFFDSRIFVISSKTTA